MGMFNDLHQQDVQQSEQQRTATRGLTARAHREPDMSPANSPDQTAIGPAAVSVMQQHSAESTPQDHKISRPAGTTSAGPSATDGELDLSQIPYKKFTYLLTPAEARALDLMKLDLSDELETTVTKEQLARCAIHFMVADFKQRGVISPVLQPLRSKTGTR